MRDSHVARRDHGGPRVAATSHGLCCQARWPSQMSIMAQGAGVAGGWQSEHAGGAYFRRHHGLSASPCLGFLTLASDPDILDVLGDGPPSPAQHRGRHRMPNSGTADLQRLTTLKGGHGKLEPWVGVSSHTALAEGSDLPGHSVCDPAAITAAWGPEKRACGCPQPTADAQERSGAPSCGLPKHKGAGPTRTLALALKLTLREEKREWPRCHCHHWVCRVTGPPQSNSGGSLTKH